MTTSNSPPTASSPPKPARLQGKRDLLHYAAYFLGVGSLVFVAQMGEPKQVKHSLLAGAIASGTVVSRDWYKARLDPNMAADPNAFIALFSEMLHAGRAQANTNSANMKRVEFLQTDLVEAMRELNDLLRLEPAEIEQKLRQVQTAHLTSALPTLNMPYPPGTNGINNTAESPGTTHIPNSTTVRQSSGIRSPGFDA